MCYPFGRKHVRDQHEKARIHHAARRRGNLATLLRQVWHTIPDPKTTMWRLYFEQDLADLGASGLHELIRICYCPPTECASSPYGLLQMTPDVQPHKDRHRSLRWRASGHVRADLWNARAELSRYHRLRRQARA